LQRQKAAQEGGEIKKIPGGRRARGLPPVGQGFSFRSDLGAITIPIDLEQIGRQQRFTLLQQLFDGSWLSELRAAPPIGWLCACWKKPGRKGSLLDCTPATLYKYVNTSGNSGSNSSRKESDKLQFARDVVGGAA
jgi:hypothetical protein